MFVWPCMNAGYVAREYNCDKENKNNFTCNCDFHNYGQIFINK